MTQMRKITAVMRVAMNRYRDTRIRTGMVRESFFEEVFSELSSMDE